MNKGFVTLLMVVSLCICCNDKPTEPQPPKDYPVYFLDGVDQSVLFRYWPKSSSLDSVVLPFEIRWDYELSPDGRLLYACGWDSLFVVSLTDSMEVLHIIPGRYRGGVAVSSDGSMLALSGPDLEILRMDDYSLVFRDSDETAQGVFSDDGREFYAVTSYQLYCANLTDTTDIERISFLDSVPRRVPTHVQPCPDGRNLLIYFRLSDFEHSLDVYDMEGDSTYHSVTLVPGAGTIVRDPGATYAYYTNAGTLAAGPLPPSEFYRFDLTTLSTDRTISTVGACEDSAFNWWPVSEVSVAPDGSWLVASHFGGFDEIVVYNLRQSTFTGFLRLNRGVLLRGLRTQANP